MNAPDKIRPLFGADDHPAVPSFKKHFERDTHFGWTPVGYWKGGWAACAAQSKAVAATPAETTPGALHGLMRRLLEDHQRVMPHDADRCPLCQDAERTLDLLADELPDDANIGPEEPIGTDASETSPTCPQQTARQSNP